MKFSIRVNNDLDPWEIVALAQTAEASGFDQIWFSNDLFLQSAPFIAGLVAARTERIHFGIGIMNPYSVHPAELAMLTATAASASGGRFMLGLGAGAENFLAWAGIPRDKPLAETRNSYRTIKALITGNRPNAHDERWGEEGFLRFPHDAPIYLGAMGPKMTELVGEIADGGLPLLYPPERFATVLAQVEKGAARSHRTLADIDLPACVWVSVGSDPLAAQAAMAEKIAYYGAAFAPELLTALGIDPEDLRRISNMIHTHGLKEATRHVTDTMLTLGMVGNPTEIIRRCQGLKDMGATHLSFGPPLGPIPFDAIALLGSEVLPTLR